MHCLHKFKRFLARFWFRKQSKERNFCSNWIINEVYNFNNIIDGFNWSHLNIFRPPCLAHQHLRTWVQILEKLLPMIQILKFSKKTVLFVPFVNFAFVASHLQIINRSPFVTSGYIQPQRQINIKNGLQIASFTWNIKKTFRF